MGRTGFYDLDFHFSRLSLKVSPVSLLLEAAKKKQARKCCDTPRGKKTGASVWEEWMRGVGRLVSCRLRKEVCFIYNLVQVNPDSKS